MAGTPIAFQPNAFQNSAFQTGEPAVPFRFPREAIPRAQTKPPVATSYVQREING